MLARGADADPQFLRDLSELTKSPSRVIGSGGYYEAAQYIEREVAKLKEVQLKVHEYPVMVPVTQRAELELGGGRVERICPFWPAQMRVCSTPPQGIHGKLIYAGECKYDQLRPERDGRKPLRLGPRQFWCWDDQTPHGRS